MLLNFLDEFFLSFVFIVNTLSAQHGVVFDPLHFHRISTACYPTHRLCFLLLLVPSYGDFRQHHCIRLWPNLDLHCFQPSICFIVGIDIGPLPDSENLPIACLLSTT